MYSDKKFRIEPQQNRAEVTAEIIMQAAIHALEEAGDIEMVTSERLANKSGFSVGSLYRYFKNKEDLYARLWQFFVMRLHGGLVAEIDSFPEHGTVRQLMMMVSDYYFSRLQKRRPKMVIPFYRLYIQSVPDPENAYKMMDVLIKPIIRAQVRNLTGTLRIMDQNEVRICLRASQAMIRNDFMEKNAYFGTEQHQRVVLDLMVRLFQK